MEGNAVDTLPVQIKLNVEMITTKRIMSNRMMGCFIQRPIIAGLFIVVENNLLIKGFGVHHVKTFCTVRMPEIKVSTSAIVL